MTDELTAISNKMANLLPLFVDGGNISGLFLPSEHSSTFKALAIEAKSILDDELGRLNEYSMNLIQSVNSGAGGFIGGPSHASVEEASKIVLAAVRAIGRKQAKVSLPSGSKPYVDPARIIAMQGLGGNMWDFTRLIELCREINHSSASRCHMSTAMLLRTILDHVPPVLGFLTFAEVANNYGGQKSQKSFKSTMQRLQLSLRNIADMHLHSSIRPIEDVPTAVQVDFAAELDALLGEVIRVAATPPP